MDSTISYESTKPAKSLELVEPFGQTGIRQHLGRVIFWLLITGFISSCGMWYRSVGFMDEVEWRGGGDVLTVSSIAGRMKFTLSSYSPTNRTGQDGWIYRGQYLNRRIQDRWKESVYKAIGFEASLSPDFRNASSGIWIRIKWYFVAGVFAFLLLLQLLLKWRHTREAVKA